MVEIIMTMDNQLSSIKCHRGTVLPGKFPKPSNGIVGDHLMAKPAPILQNYYRNNK
jgi:hypothetical protein